MSHKVCGDSLQAAIGNEYVLLHPVGFIPLGLKDLLGSRAGCGMNVSQLMSSPHGLLLPFVPVRLHSGDQTTVEQDCMPEDSECL